MKFAFKTCISFLFGLIHLILTNASSESFSEELLIKPLPTGHVYSFFQFITKWDVDPEETQREPAIFFSSNLIRVFFKVAFLIQVRHYNLFPRSIGEIIQKHSLRELHLSLTQSLWRTQKWGYPVRFAGPGAEVFATFHPHLNK
jgi:phosphatidylinositol glycan class T